MPQPLAKLPKDLSSSPRITKRRALLLAILVKTIDRYSSMEFSLCMLFGLLLRIETSIAADLFFSTMSLPLRLDMIRAAARSELKKPWRDRLNTILDNIRKAARKRNIVAHSGWSVSRTYPDALIRTEISSMASEMVAALIAARNAIEKGKKPRKHKLSAAGHIKYDENDLIALLNAVEDADTKLMLFIVDLLNDRCKHLPEFAEWRKRNEQNLPR